MTRLPILMMCRVRNLYQFESPVHLTPLVLLLPPEPQCWSSSSSSSPRLRLHSACVEFLAVTGTTPLDLQHALRLPFPCLAGVGGWSEVGVDSGAYSEALLNATKECIDDHLADATPPRPRNVCDYAHANTKEKVRHGRLYYVSLRVIGGYGYLHASCILVSSAWPCYTSALSLACSPTRLGALTLQLLCYGIAGLKHLVPRDRWPRRQDRRFQHR